MTVNSRQGFGATDVGDPLHEPSSPEFYWTTTNAGEAIPGVQTPLSMTTWIGPVTQGVEASVRGIGIVTDAHRLPTPPMHRFFGRATMSVDFLRLVGDRMPGATGTQVVSGLIGYVPDGMTFAPTKRFYLNVARCFPRTFLRIPAELVSLSREQDTWWRTAAVGVERLDETSARARLEDAVAHHRRATVAQCIAVFVGVQPVHDAIERLAGQFAPDHAATLTTPAGGAEMAVIADIWRASRGLLDVGTVAGSHGFHGPFEGELSSRVWRDDASPLEKMVERYAARPDSDSPLELEAERVVARREAELALVAAAPYAARPAVRGILALGRRRLLLRGVAKRSMLQGFDGVRAASRRLGDILAEDGRLADPDDVFYLTLAELRDQHCAPDRDRVQERRARREEYQAVSLPTTFRGNPDPIRTADEALASDVTIVEGVGVSGGIVEGVARVVTDPGFDDVEDDEILIAPTTDPSWSSIMFVSAALVVDIGGALSHAAVVAREIGIPCVVNTKHGTTAIRTGDRVRVDGRTGIVEILEKAPSS